MEFSKEDEEAVKWCEDNYTEMTAEYKKIMMEQYVLFCKKHRNYGTGNINVGTNLDTDADVNLSNDLLASFKKCSDVCSPIAVDCVIHMSNVNRASLISASHLLFRALYNLS